MTETNQQQGQSHSLDSLLTFYDQANGALRVALLIVVLWPLSALAAAMIFHGSKAQTIVPIIDMIPLGAVLFVIIGAPFGLGVLLQHPLAKKGFIFLVGLIGIELAIGVYLALIPVSSDNGLVPLLMLGSMALFCLSVAKFARPLRILLTMCLVIITLVFILGGRPSFSSAVKNAMSTLVRHDFANQNFSSFTIPVASDLWTQEVVLPKTWKKFNLAVNRNFDDASPENAWFAYRCSGTSGQLIDSGVVYKAGQPYDDSMLGLCTGPIQFRGHANIVFERSQIDSPSSANVSQISPVTTPVQQPSPNPGSSVTPADSAVPTAVVSKPLQPDWTKTQEAATQDYVASAPPCIVQGMNVRCYFRLTNQGPDKSVSITDFHHYYPTRMIDDEGKEYIAVSVTLGASLNNTRASTVLPSGVPILGSATFQNVTGNKVALFEINVIPRIRPVPVSFRDIPIVRPQP